MYGTATGSRLNQIYESTTYTLPSQRPVEIGVGQRRQRPVQLGLEGISQSLLINTKT